MIPTFHDCPLEPKIMKCGELLYFEILHAPSELLLPSANKLASKAGLARPVSSKSEGARRISKKEKEIVNI